MVIPCDLSHILHVLNSLRDAGITLSCHVSGMLKKGDPLAKALLPAGPPSQLRVLELGTGCGMVGEKCRCTRCMCETMLTSYTMD